MHLFAWSFPHTLQLRFALAFKFVLPEVSQIEGEKKSGGKGAGEKQKEKKWGGVDIRTITVRI